MGLQLAMLQAHEERVPSAEFSMCSVHRHGCDSPSCAGRLYRYLLRWPTGLDNDLICLGIFANPSTADASQLDPTLTRWRNYCRAWGFGWSCTANIRAWRATDPKKVPEDSLAVGDANWHWLTTAVDAADLVVCGWGKLGGELASATARRIRLRSPNKQLHALKLNKDGSPQHPLYLASGLKPFPMENI